MVNPIETIQSKRTGTKIIRTSEVDLHHHIARFDWKLVKEDSTTLLKGLDIVYFDEQDSKIESIIGFFGQLKPIENLE